MKNDENCVNVNRSPEGRNVPVTVAARIMGKSPMFIRIGLQRGLLPFGVAFKTNEAHEQFDYYISPYRFAEFTGCSLFELERAS